MNDMLSTLTDGLGMEPSGVEGMMFMQGMLNRNQLDKRFFKCRLCSMGQNYSKRIAAWLVNRNETGRVFTLPDCERKRARQCSVSTSVT
jgi:citrate lyase synthetase